MKHHFVPNHPNQSAELEHCLHFFGNDPLKHGVLGVYDLKQGIFYRKLRLRPFIVIILRNYALSVFVNRSMRDHEINGNQT